MTGLRIAPNLVLPIEMATEPLGIMANRGRGKSYATHVFVEEIHDAGVPVVILDVKGDWWGVRSSADGRSDGMPFYIFGGDHADLPLEPTAGELLADLVVDERVSVVLDLSHLSKTKARTFAMVFAERLYHRNREPVFLVVDEADVLIPQRQAADTARLLGAMEDLAKRGRGRGIGMAVVTQRPQEVAKSVLDLMDTLLLLGMTGPKALASVKAWVGVHVDEETTTADVMATLPSMPVGDAWLWSPMRDILQRIHVRPLRTFDSHPTPVVGETRQTPKTRVSLDLDALGDRIAETVERAKADDPKALRARVRDLEQQLAAAIADKPEPVEVSVEVPVLAPEIVDQLEALLEPAVALLGETQETLAKHRAWAEEQLEQARAPRRTQSSLPSRPTATAGSTRTATSGRREPTTRAATHPAGQGTTTAWEEVRLRTGAHRMVEALGRMAPLRLTKSQWGTVARLKTSGGTWSTYLSDIRRAGLIDENPAGYTLTDVGFDYLGGRPDPMTAAELQDHYRSILRSGAVKMLDALMDAYPEYLTREELGAAADIAITGGTFSMYLSDLVRNGLADRVDGQLIATDILMHGADQ